MKKYAYFKKILRLNWEYNYFINKYEIKKISILKSKNYKNLAIYTYNYSIFDKKFFKKYDHNYFVELKKIINNNAHSITIDQFRYFEIDDINKIISIFMQSKLKYNKKIIKLSVSLRFSRWSDFDYKRNLKIKKFLNVYLVLNCVQFDNLLYENNVIYIINHVVKLCYVFKKINLLIFTQDIEFKYFITYLQEIKIPLNLNITIPVNIISLLLKIKTNKYKIGFILDTQLHYYYKGFILNTQLHNCYNNFPGNFFYLKLLKNFNKYIRPYIIPIINEPYATFDLITFRNLHSNHFEKITYKTTTYKSKEIKNMSRNIEKKYINKFIKNKIIY